MMPVLAVPDADPKNEGGFVLWVAIADVANYVRPGSALDREARKRGQFHLFSRTGWCRCCLTVVGRPLFACTKDVPRACIAVRMRINAKGEKLEHRFPCAG